MDVNFMHSKKYNLKFLQYNRMFLQIAKTYRQETGVNRLENNLYI